MNGLRGIRTDYRDIATRIDVRIVAEMFTQAAEDLHLDPDDLAEAVGERMGFVKHNSDTSDGERALSDAANGVFSLLGMRPDANGGVRTLITAGRAYQVAYILRLVEDQLDET